jgi:hypothetical protein
MAGYNHMLFVYDKWDLELEKLNGQSNTELKKDF